MTYLSICSGIEAATVAWHSLGWKPLAFSEIEKFPSAVLAHHWPDVPNLGDITRYANWPAFRPKLIVAGSPCQSFSIAGLRKGLADPRGNLTLTYLAIVERYRPRWVVWENVPGVLSERTGAFGAFTGGLAKLGYGWAYRILDAQHFGVPQRRRRVFVVGHLGDWRRAAAVLFESHCMQGHPAPGFKESGWAAKVFPTVTRRGPGSLREEQGYIVEPDGRIRHPTPKELERLQGFPDDHTAIPWRGKPAGQCPDGPRYKAIGNSMAVPVMRWIGERINLIEKLSTPEIP